MRDEREEARTEVTQLLARLGQGDAQAADELMPVVYHELRALAGAYLARERADHTLQATALVHEAFLALVRQPEAKWEERAHFFRVAALAMRHVLVNHARDRDRLKRGGGATRVALDGLDPAESAHPVDVLALDDALHKLAEVDPRKEQIVQLRYFGGFGIEDTASVMGLSPAQVKREWASARAFLLRELGGGG